MTTMKAVRLFELGWTRKAGLRRSPDCRRSGAAMSWSRSGQPRCRAGPRVPHRRGASSTARPPDITAASTAAAECQADAAGPRHRGRGNAGGRGRDDAGRATAARPDQSREPAVARRAFAARQSVRRRRPARSHHVRRLRAVRRAAGELLDQDHARARSRPGRRRDVAVRHRPPHHRRPARRADERHRPRHRRVGRHGHRDDAAGQARGRDRDRHHALSRQGGKLKREGADIVVDTGCEDALRAIRDITRGEGVDAAVRSIPARPS